MSSEVAGYSFAGERQCRIAAEMEPELVRQTYRMEYC